MDSGHNWEDEELIERYFDGLCNEEELHLFEERYGRDPVFAKNADAMRAISEGVSRMYDEDRIRRLVAEAAKKEKQRRLYIHRLFWSFGGTFAAAASFVLFLAYSPLNVPVQTQEIRTVRNLQRTYQADSLESEKKRAFGLFFEAQSYLAEGALQPAILRLEELTEIRELRPYFREAVQWHLVVAHLKNGNPDRAQLFYDELKEPAEYPIPRINRWKAWWQLHRKKWIG